MGILNPVYEAVAWVLKQIYQGLGPVFGYTSGWTWFLSIVILVILMRLIMVPLFIKQMHTTRAMSALAPQMQALRKKYKNDKQTLQQETMKLYQEAGVNPLMGCLPVVLQLPLFFALFSVLKAISEWKPGQKGTGTSGPGIAFAKYKTLATYVAVIVELELDRASGRIKVPRAYAAADAGLIVNPDGLTNQIEGGIVQSTSWTLHEEVRYDKNGIVSQSWDSYPILTMREAPTVSTVLIDRPNEHSLGAGEASQGPTVAAIANAFAAATGRRIRELPLHPERVKAALG